MFVGIYTVVGPNPPPWTVEGHAGYKLWASEQAALGYTYKKEGE